MKEYFLSSCKEEIANFEHFLLLQLCFNKSSAADASNLKCIYKLEKVIFVCINPEVKLQMYNG